MTKLLSPAALDSDPLSPAKDVVFVSIGGGAFEEGECRALLVGVAGTVNITTGTGEIRNLVPVTAGVNPIRVKEVHAATASNIWAMY